MVRSGTSVDDASPSPRRSGGSSARFATRCLSWAREAEQVHTGLVPGNVLPGDGPDRVSFDGYTLQRTRSSWVAYAGLLAIVFVWLTSAIAERIRLPAPLDAVVGWIDGAILAGVAGSWLVSWLLHRRARSPLLALVDTGDDAVTESELRTMQATSRGRRLWVFARRGFDGSAAAFALAAGIRCLVPSGPGFVDTGAEPVRAPPSVARVPRGRGR